MTGIKHPPIPNKDDSKSNNCQEISLTFGKILASFPLNKPVEVGYIITKLEPDWKWLCCTNILAKKGAETSLQISATPPRHMFQF